MVVKRLHAVVNRDAQCPRLARKTPTHHGSDAELAESVCKRQNGGRQNPGQASGPSMRRKRCQGDKPQQAAASRTSTGTASNARWIGCTTNGMFTIAESTTSPGNENASVFPTTLSNAAPSGDRG